MIHPKWGVLIAVGTSMLLAAMTGSVVNMVLPLIAKDFHAPIAAVEWVVMIYLLGISALLLTFGRLGDMVGHRKVYVTGFAVFVAASGLCGLAPGEYWLIGFRVLQAIGASMVYANAPAILVSSFPPEERGRALGLQGMLVYVGLTLGPALGGPMASLWGWRSVFFLNVPLGLLGLAIAWKLIPAAPPAPREERFDRLGAVFFTLGLVSLLLGLSQGPHWGWTSAGTLGLLAGAIAFLIAFLATERRFEHPMLDLSLFKAPIFSASTVSALLNYVCIYAVLFLLPFYLIDGRHLDPAQAGLLLAAQPIVMAVVAPLAGEWSDRIGSTALAVTGMAILGVGLFMLSRLGPETPLSYAAGALAVVGLGTGLFVSPNNSALMGAAPQGRQGIAGGVLATARNLGMVLGVALAGAVYATMLVRSGGSPSATFEAVDVSFLVTTGVAIAGALTSLVKPRAVTTTG